jgi:hypothetical protein
MIYRVETFPHYQKESILTWSDVIHPLQVGINVVELEQGKFSYINIREATEEEIEWLKESNKTDKTRIWYANF